MRLFSSGTRPHVACLFFAILHTTGYVDGSETHLLQNKWSSNVWPSAEEIGEALNHPQARFRRNIMGEQQQLPLTERNDRAKKQTFRLELLRQIKAIDHMKCFPKVLCGLSVDSDKSFGINKSNFVRSYLELMRNIKPTGDSAQDRVRTEDEVEDDLRWPFSPHNPDRKDHSSFERLTSAAMSASVEVPDSLEYLRGLDALSSLSFENVERRGDVRSTESKEKLDSSDSSSTSSLLGRTGASKIPGEKKKKNGNKSLTSKLTSYITSWLPEMASFGKDPEEESSIEPEFGDESGRSAAMNINHEAAKQSAPFPFENILPNDPVLLSLIKRARQSRLEDTNAGQPAQDEGSPATRDDIHGESAEHDADIYHTAVNIGKRLKDPKQCDYIYNGCPLEYNNILQMINSIRTEIKQDDTAEAVSKELGLITTTSSTTTTTRRPQRKKGKPRPSTKIMHTLPNGEKVEINFRLAGSEDSDESSAQRVSSQKKELSSDEMSSEKDSKATDEFTVVDVDQRSSLSSEEDSNSDKMLKSFRKGSPSETVVLRKSDKKKVAYLNTKRKIAGELRNDELIRSDQSEFNEESSKSTSAASSASTAQSSGVHNTPLKSTIKLGGLSLTTNNEDQPLEISPSYVIIKHQPLSVHTTSLLSPDNLQTQSVQTGDKLQAFQLVQGGHHIDPDLITDQLKHYIRQSGGIIPKLSLHSSGLITADGGNSPLNSGNPFAIHHHHHHRPSIADMTSSISQKTHESFANPLASLSMEPQKPQTFSQYLPYSPYSSKVSTGPEMVGAVPGRQHDSFIKPKSTTTTSTSTTTENIVFAGMAETLTLDTDEITDDTVDKLEGHNTVPGWIRSDHTSSSSGQDNSNEKDKHAHLLESLKKSLLNDKNASRIRYKNPKKKKTRTKANSSRVRSSVSKGNRNKGSVGSGERVVIKHAGPYSSNSRPQVYKSPLQGPGPHGGAFPYLLGGVKPGVFSPYPFWRL